MGFLSGCPVWNSETFEESPRFSIEVNFFNSFDKGRGMEVLCINVKVDVRFFKKFVMINIFNSNTYIIIIKLKREEDCEKTYQLLLLSQHGICRCKRLDKDG